MCASRPSFAQDETELRFRLFQPDNAPWGEAETGEGFIVEITETAFKRAGIPYDIVFAPWKREQAAVQQRGFAFMAPLTRIEARENLYQWVAPVNISYLQLVTTKASYVNWKFEDLLRLPVAARMESPAEFTARGLGFETITLVEDEEVAARLLGAGRVTLWMQRGLPGRWAYTKAGGENSVLHTLGLWTTPEQYLVASLDVPHGVTEKLRAELIQMRLSGELDKIKQSYFEDKLPCVLLFTCVPEQE